MQFIVGNTTGNGENNVSLQVSAYGFVLIGWLNNALGAGVNISMQADTQQVIPGGAGGSTIPYDGLLLNVTKQNWFRLGSKHNQWYFSYPDTGVPGNRPVFMVIDDDFCLANPGALS